MGKREEEEEVGEEQVQEGVGSRKVGKEDKEEGELLYHLGSFKAGLNNQFI